MLFKKRVTIENMSKALYAYAIDKTSMDWAINLLDKTNNLDTNLVKTELTLLIIVIIEYLSRSKKNADKLMMYFLSHFKSETEKNGTSDDFINLLEDRGKVYNEFMKNDSSSATTHSPYLIAEQFQNYCGVQNDPLFIMKAMKIWEYHFNTLASMFSKFKLVD